MRRRSRAACGFSRGALVGSFQPGTACTQKPKKCSIGSNKSGFFFRCVQCYNRERENARVSPKCDGLVENYSGFRGESIIWQADRLVGVEQCPDYYRTTLDFGAGYLI